MTEQRRRELTIVAGLVAFIAVALIVMGTWRAQTGSGGPGVTTSTECIIISC